MCSQSEILGNLVLFGKERKRNIHPCPWKVMEESQGETTLTCLPEQVQKYKPNDGKVKSIHAGIVKLLWDSEHEE